MSLFLDQKYLSLISNRLPLFKRKGDRLYNCRCILCGDSLKKINKTRGYFYAYKTELRYKCHNCNASLSFGNFLKNLDNALFEQYRFESYTENKSLTLSNTNPAAMVFEEPKFKTEEERLLDRILARMDTLADDHPAVLFLKNRLVPTHQYKHLYFIENIKDIVQLNDKYKEGIKGSEPRIVIPFYNEYGKLVGVTCRAIGGEALRYVAVRISETEDMIFGIDKVDKNKTVYVVEGPIDSLFIDNCIAVGSSALNKVRFSTISPDKLVYIYDNQPRNKELCKIIKQTVEQGNQIVIWPQNISEKDINDMVLAGRDVKKLIKENTYSGLTAMAKFYSWKRV